MSRRLTTVTLALAAMGAAALWAGETRVTPVSAHVGAWGLEVVLGGACGGPAVLDLDAADGPLIGLYEACQDLTAQDVAVEGLGAVIRAGNTITLGEGFSIATGATLDLEIDAAVGSFPSILDLSPIDENVYHATFYVNRDGLILGAGDEIEHFTAYDSIGDEVFRLVLQPDGAGGAEIHLAARQDGGGWIATAPGQEIALPGGWIRLEVSWTAADGAGELRIGVDDGPMNGLTALDNDAYTVDRVRWGVIAGSIASSSGLLRLDAFNSWR